jgi:hypothetical protein
MDKGGQFAVVLCGLLAGFLGGVAGRCLPAGGVVTARELILKDSDGRSRWVLSAPETGPLMVMKDAQGRARLKLGEFTTGKVSYAGLQMLDSLDHERFTCGGQTDGSGSGMGLWDQNGTLRYGLGFTDKGNGGMTMFDQQGRERFGLGDAGPRRLQPRLQG